MEKSALILTSAFALALILTLTLPLPFLTGSGVPLTADFFLGDRMGLACIVEWTG